MNKIIASIFCMTSLFMVLGQSHDCSPVTELKALYKSDKSFRENIDAMFLGVQPLKDGSPNPWVDKDINDLYQFLNDWFYFQPNPHNGLDRILAFSFLYYNNPAGMEFILSEKGKKWTISFVEERGRYMDSQAST